MLSLRSTSPFDIFDRLEQQLSQQLQNAERIPAAEVHETPEAYTVFLELPGVDRDVIDVKATERTVLISAERRNSRASGGSETESSATPVDVSASGEASNEDADQTRTTLLVSEFRYGTWSRSFRFPQAIERESLQARYRDGLLEVTAPKAHKVSTVSVKVEG